MTLVTAVSGPTPWRKGQKPLPNSTTTLYDSVDLDLFKVLKYVIVFWNESNSRYMSLELSVLNANGTIKEIISNKIISGSVDIEITTSINAGFMDLEVVNNEGFDIETRFAKLRLG